MDFQPGTSEAIEAGTNLRLVDSLQDYHFKGLQERFMTRLKLPSAWVSNQAEKSRIIAELFSSNGSAGQAQPGVVQYPYALFTLQSIAEDPERGNMRSMAKRGSPVMVTTDRRRYLMVHYAPVVYRVQVEYVTNSLAHLKGFTRALLLARLQGWFNFNIAYGRTSFTVRVLVDGDVSMPQREDRAQGAAEFALQTNFQMKGFIDLPDLTEGEVISEIGTEIFVQREGMENSTNGAVSAWKFPSSAPQQTGVTSTVKRGV